MHFARVSTIICGGFFRVSFIETSLILLMVLHAFSAQAIYTIVYTVLSMLVCIVALTMGK